MVVQKELQIMFPVIDPSSGEHTDRRWFARAGRLTDMYDAARWDKLGWWGRDFLLCLDKLGV